MRFAIDTNVASYAVGEDSPYREACRSLLRLAAEGALVAEASVLVLQEFLHVRARRTGDREAAGRLTRALAGGLVLHPVEVDDVTRALDLFAATPGLDALDAVHAATCLNRGIEVVVTADGAFDGVLGLRRVDPRDAVPLLLPAPPGDTP